MLFFFLRLLVSLPARNRGADVGILPSFASAAQQEDDRLSVAPEIHATARTEIQPQFGHAFAQRLGRAEISRFQPPDVTVNPRRRHGIKTIKPSGERLAFVFDVFTDLE
jgi:hypothetical protein